MFQANDSCGRSISVEVFLEEMWLVGDVSGIGFRLQYKCNTTIRRKIFKKLRFITPCQKKQRL